MLFLIDDKNKIIIGWSAKCGCSHIKKIFYYLNNQDYSNDKLHRCYNSKLPSNINEYTTFIIVRNPYQRIVSGFIEKYNPDNGTLNKRWGNNNNLTFKNFVDEIIKNTWQKIEHHHFSPQTSEGFNYNIISKSKNLYVYDIKNINYEKISSIYNMNIPNELISFRGNHSRKTTKNNIFNSNIYNMKLQEIYEYDIDYSLFYNEEIKTKIYSFFKKDFIFCNLYGINYNI